MTAPARERVVAGRGTRLCARGLHADVPANEYRPPGGGRRRCRPCRAEYMRERRAASGVVVVHGRARPGGLRPAELDRLRRAVACRGCGAHPEEVRGAVLTRHERGCAVALLEDYSGRWPAAGRS